MRNYRFPRSDSLSTRNISLNPNWKSIFLKGFRKQAKTTLIFDNKKLFFSMQHVFTSYTQKML